MALTNFTLPFGGISHHWSATTIGPASLQQYHASAVNNLLYDPADHQESDDPPEYFKNNPYAPPQNHHHQYNSNNNNNNNGRIRNSKSYLPPLPSSQTSTQRHNSHYQTQHQTTNTEQQTQQQQDQQLGYNTRTRNNNNNHDIQYNSHHQTNHQPAVQIPKGNYLPVHQQNSQLSSQQLQPQQQQQQQQQQHEDTSNSYADGDNDTIYDNNNNNQYQHHQQYLPPSSLSSSPSSLSSSPASSASHNSQGQYFNGYNTYTRTYSSHNIGVTQPTLSISTNQQIPTYSNNNNSGGRNIQNHNRNNNYNNNGNNSGPNRGDPTSGYKTKNQGSSSSVSSSSSSSSSSSLTPSGSGSVSDDDNNDDDSFPERPPGFTRVQAGQGSRTQVHAVLDYDIDEGDEEYYDDTDNDGKKSSMPTVTPIQGPIFLKNGTVPVVPLFSYPTVNNGTFVQIPIWWTALSVALGLDIRGDVIRGVPCIKRYHQLFCPTAGNSYPIEKIEKFIDDNKALMRRMYGDFEMTDYGTPIGQSRRRRRRYIDDPDIFVPPGAFPADAFESQPDTEAGETYFGKLRKKRQSSGNRNKNNQKPGTNRGGPNIGRGSNAPNSNTDSGSGKVDVCESKVEVVTPYWASNSAGKIRAIVNTQHFEQAIHQEMCTKVTTARCGNDCGCEQKYKWHRLLAYDPDNDCKGIFMDWFLFPSCCVCRCSP